MNLFGLNISISRSTASSRQKSYTPSPEEWLRGEDLSRGGAVLSNAYQQVVWVYRAINVLAEQVANIPFRFSIGEAGGDHLITSGPLLDFYARPHPQCNRFQYWELRVIWLMLRGECMRVPIFEEPVGSLSLSSGGEGWGEVAPASRCFSSLSPSDGERARVRGSHSSPRRRLRSVLILDPSRFQHIVQDHQLLGWRYTGFSPETPLESQVFLPEEVWFEKLPNPFDFWRGMSPLGVAAMAAKTDFAAGAFMRELIENNADPGLIVRSAAPMGEEQEAQVKAALNNRKGRAGMADRPLLLSGVAEIIRPELSSSDLQFLENRKFSRGEICAAFGVPEEIVTTTDTAKYDVMAGARLNFIENRIAPLCRRLEDEENSTTIPAILGRRPTSLALPKPSTDGLAASKPQAETGWFDLDSLPIMQEARRGRLATAKIGFDMGVPFNELNRVLELGFKPLPWGNTGHLAANLKKAGEEKASPERGCPQPQQPPTSEAPAQ